METPLNTPTETRLPSGLGAVLAAAAFLLCAGAFAPSAQADLTFCSPGGGAGQCSEPRGVAADTETGRVYVADRGNNRVNVFDDSGAFLFAFGWGVDTGDTKLETCTTASVCQPGSAGPGAGQLSRPAQIAVDNVVGSASRHDIYVGTTDFRVQKFKPDASFELAFGTPGEGECQISQTIAPFAVGPAGNVFVADAAGSEPNFTQRVMKFSPAGACLGETVIMKGNKRATALAVDPAEDAWISDERISPYLRKYDLATAETELCALDPGHNTNALAIDAAGALYASQSEPVVGGGSEYQVITKSDSASCAHLQRFGYDQIEFDLLGLAVHHSAQGDVLASEANNNLVRYLSIPPLGPIVVPSSVEVPSIGNAQATVRAEVNPEGKATEVKVQYVDKAHFDSEGGFASPATKTSEPVLLAAGFSVRAAELLLGCAVATKELIEEGKCLDPETEYRFRLLATNADDTDTLEGGFTTKKPLEVEEAWVTAVGADAASLNALVNPLGIPATGYFEYVEEAIYLTSGFANAVKVPNPDAGQAEIDFGSASTATQRSANAFPLAPGTTYRYRVSATNPLIEERLFSEEGTFRTFPLEVPESCPANEALRYGASALLSDCRAYEMVSPLDKDNGDVIVLGEALTNTPATLNQSSTLGSRLAYGTYRSFGDAKSAPFTSQYIASRGAGGWASHAISPPIDGGVVENIIQLFDNEFRAFSDDLCQGWIVTQYEPTLAPGANEGYRNLYRRGDRLCGPESYETLSDAAPQNIGPGPDLTLELQGISAASSIVAFAANDSLEGSGAPSNAGKDIQLYARGPGQGPRYVCILPNGASAPRCSAGTGPDLARFGKSRTASVTNALSDDGSRLYWSNSNAEGRIYLRLNPLGEGAECVEPSSPCTIEVSKAGEEAAATSGSRFWGAAADGSAALYTTGGRLYRFAVEGESTQLIATGAIGLVGASEDASRVYFAATQAIAGSGQSGDGEEAAAGKPNLYLYEADGGAGSYRFIGTLAAGDVDPVNAAGDSSPVAFEPRFRNGRVSPDGLHAAFMSEASLTGYDNTDAASGEADTEVFLYDAAAAGGAGELICASCNPSGARPAGANVISSKANPFWVAAKIPVFQNTLYASRVLADDGSRLFFESQDALVARDTNARIDVYQWEAPGTGTCSPTSVSFAPSAQGCVSMISSGQSVRNSEFVDASPSGDDVFFATLSSLYPADFGLVDIYDARVGGGFEAPPAPPVECEGETCQNPPPAPPFTTPSTLAYSGPGNLKEATGKRHRRCRKGRHRVRRAGKVRCAKNRKAKRRAGQRRRSGR